MKILAKIYSRMIYIVIALVWIFLTADIIYKFLY